MLRKRYRRITNFFARVIISLIFWELLLPRIGFRWISKPGSPERMRKIAEQFRHLAVDMGGLMIKVGQFLSTRVDVLPEEITRELANLQDEVKPESFERIRVVAEDELNSRLEDSFYSIEKVAMASASLGQVHKARLIHAEAGIEDVVVKVQRPNIEMIITTDLAALKTVGKWIKRYPPIAKRADLDALLDEFARITFQEIDYIQEGKNAETFAVNFDGCEEIRVPKVIWSVTSKRVLTLENVQAIKITDYEAISAKGISRPDVAQRLFEAYLKQIFEDGFFHADPHPGNLFVEPMTTDQEMAVSESPWRLNFVDFGMVGVVSPHIRAGLREMAMGIGTQDSARLVKSYQMLGVLLPDANLDLIEKLEKRVFEKFWGKSMAELQKVDWDEIHQFAKDFREIIYDMPFQVPEDLIFLGRCVAILAGMCTGLDPDFNVWEGLAPFARKIIQEESIKGWDFWRQELTMWGQLLIFFPRRLDRVLRQLEQGEMAVDTPSLNQQAARLERTGQRLIFSVIFAVLFFSGIQLFLADAPGFGISLLLLSIIPLWRAAFIWR